MAVSNFQELTFNLPNGKPYPVAELKGKTILVVNTATKCGLTPQFGGLELLHAKFNPDGLVILGFPCNQFGGQEPETNETMIETCEINHGVTFQLLEKTEVNGKNTHPVFKWLKSETGGFFGSRIKWNFTKFLIAPDGKTIKRYSSVTKPEKIEADIKALLK
ncbi:MAG: glutathione peroxidase [Crocinitomix sp.]|jgi:glutathione peroxidase